MVGPMNRECSANLGVGRSAVRDFSFDPDRMKYDVWISRGFQNFLVHPGIARLISTLTASCVDDNFADGFAGVTIEGQRTSGNGKCSVNGVERAGQRPMYL